MPDQPNRRLAAIMFTDIVDYTAMMRHDERAAVAVINRHQEVLEATVGKYNGNVLQYYGDGSLSAFSSAVSAVEAARQIQLQLRDYPQVPLRIGLHIGEISFENEKVFGDGVNIASRIESLGQPGTVFFSRHVYDKIRNRPEFQAKLLGSFTFKNIEEPIKVFALANDGFPVPKRSELSGKLQPPPKMTRKNWLRLAAGVLIAAACFLLGGLLTDFKREQEQVLTPKHYQIGLPASTPIDVNYNQTEGFSTRAFDISPAGDMIVYVGENVGKHALFIRKTDSWESTRLPGTDGAYSPFFSPDGHWVGFYADKKLKKISVQEKNPDPVIICEVSLPYGVDWGPDNTILFSNNDSRVLAKVSADGGQPEVVFDVRSPDWGQHLVDFQLVSFLPGGKQILTTDADDFILHYDFETKAQTLLPFRGNNPVYIQPGYLVYTRFEQLFAVPFDPVECKILGSPVLISSNIKTNGVGTSQVAFSENGILAYVHGLYDKNSNLVQVFRDGRKVRLPFPSDNHGTFQLAPDGKHLAIEITAFNSDEIWIYDLKNGTKSRLTQAGNNYGMAWTPDGSSLAFLSHRNDSWGLFKKSRQGTAPAEKIMDLRFRPYYYSPNGKWLVGTTEGVCGIYFGDTLSLHQFYEGTATTSHATVSPDNRWLAYHSDESGQFEVYIQPLPSDGRRWLVSKGGGNSPLWSRTSHELFYENAPQIKNISFRTNSEDVPEFDEPRVVFEGNYVKVGGLNYDVMPDGNSFLVLEAVDTTSLYTEIRIIENWLELLKNK